MRALISVSDKSGIVEFSKKLVDLGVEIVSTGGTAKKLIESGVPVIGISEVTGFPECLDGRVKTLHPNIHAGLLAIRGNEEHMKQIKELDVTPIDLVVVNLYPFKATIMKDNVTREDAIENIDIGGPTMLRSAAKNYGDVAVVVDPADYEGVLKELEENKEVSADTKFYLSSKVFEHTAAYDTLIANYMRKERKVEELPETLTMTFEKVQDMRYGENPHQKAAFYKEVNKQKGYLANAEQLHGKELSFNNINDTNGALELVKEFDEPTVVACKHANPCGVGSADKLIDAYKKAYAADPVSIYGGIVVVNREIDAETAAEINKIFIEIVVAPSYTEEAIEILKSKKNIRILKLENINEKQPDDAYDLKKVGGGLLVQTIDSKLLSEEGIKVVTERKPSDKEMEDLLFAWKIVKYAKSNGISIAKDKQSLGVGPGQVSRIWAAKQAADHAVEHLGKESLEGSALASDAFFPFADSIEVAVESGIKAIIQPGGSIRDEEVIKACNDAGIAMVFTGMRHFKH
ncbi:phosphoribosylaminoimidazolecarboxamide formyltransferase / IMP cyclohydrolase [Dethiosulfatibacter aminovorans DSM 17477]|uniref:Bifunctional purine biosynthesis protein PurH n=1 Tax=Dethiosulfatibacter aminovorans DSM 17477 TaxID=1121476 RepID=A0A1M6FP02_9FIRM|nr:bifunctional phosphoribosylaminoimidazolecarboxamide formyltransferase/IMP cyclohydrolase [Dethiosulfatibacter aminovorans]SHI99406.1 phosphoribosylaminoimidazolecarboxamide formyltransferase / IMP cyclohydrolase [Dethiosulfatibacter aminovorans DSM 17477]